MHLHVLTSISTWYAPQARAHTRKVIALYFVGAADVRVRLTHPRPSLFRLSLFRLSVLQLRGVASCVRHAPCAHARTQAEEDAYIDSASERLLRQSWHARWRQSPPTPPPPHARTAASAAGRSGQSRGGAEVGDGEVDEFGVETSWVRGGHVTSFFTEHATFRGKMLSALGRLR